MTTLFRIVEDDRPPLPENISPELRDFLIKCFCKEPEDRPTARELLLSPWLRDAIANLHKVISDTPNQICHLFLTMCNYLGSFGIWSGCRYDSR
jgi:serine/threonine protein kinase